MPGAVNRLTLTAALLAAALGGTGCEGGEPARSGAAATWRRLVLHAARSIRLGCIAFHLTFDQARQINEIAFDRACLTVLFLNLEIDFFAVHHDLQRCLDSKPYLTTVDTEDGDFDVVTNRDALALLAREYEHSPSLARAL